METTTVSHQPRPEYKLFTLKPPPGGTLRILSDITVDQELEWRKAVTEAGPDTTPNSPIFEIAGRHCPPFLEDEPASASIILLGHSRIFEWSKGLEWARLNGLKNAHPRIVFALCEQNPHLPKFLQGFRNDALVSVAASQSFEVRSHLVTCFSWFNCPGRKVTLGPIGPVNSSRWLAFTL